MKTGIGGTLILLVLWVLIACTSASGTPAPRLLSDGVHFLVAVEGKVEIRRRGWAATAYTPALLGTQLHPGDRIKMAADARAMIVCADLTRLPLLPEDTTAPCPAAIPVMTYQGIEIPATRVGFVDFPQVVLPRMGKLMNTRPTVRWMPLPDAATVRYEIRLSGDSVNWQITASGATEMTYPPDQPSLRPGERYELEIRAGGRSSWEEGGGLGFYVVTLEEAQIIEQARQRILDLQLQETATQFLLSHLYRSHGYYTEAIEELDALSGIVAEPAVERALGDLYWEVELMRLAETHYLAAVRLSHSVGDHEGEAWARKQLGKIYLYYLGNGQEGLAMLESARTGYGELGDAARVAEIDQHLAALQ